MKVGILLDDELLCHAFAEIVRDLRQSNFVDIELLIIKRSEGTAVSHSPNENRLFRTLRMLGRASFWKSIGWTIFERIDKRFFSSEHDPMGIEDCSALFAGVPVLEVTPIASKFVHRFPDDAVAEIREKRLDVMIRFGFNILRGDILNVARCGIWSFHHGDNTFYRGGPSHFWELVERNPLSGVILQILSEKLDDGLVLAKGQFATRQGISLIQNRVQPYWGSTHMMIQKLWELHHWGFDYIRERAVPHDSYQGKRKLYRTPSNLELARWLVPQLIVKVARRCVNAVRREDLVHHWRVAIGRSRAPDDPEVVNTADFQWIDSPAGHFWADPFLFDWQDTTHLFMEDLNYAENRGVIVHAELSADGELGPVATVLDTGTHLSYPCVFRDGSDVYMIPESQQAGVVQVYRAKTFPTEWEMIAEPFTGRAVDTTAFTDQDTWWFFTTLLEPRGRGLALFLFWAETPYSDWHSHRQNPISIDVRSARGAGNVFRLGASLIRPSQDCSGIYGRSFALNRIRTLTRDAYAEEEIRVVEPDWAPGLVGSHTFNRSRRFDATDGQFVRRRRAVQ